MNTRKIVVSMLVAVMLLPTVSFGQTTSTLTPSRDELVMKLIASLMEQIKVLQAQLAILKEKEATDALSKQATSTPIKTVVSEFVAKKAVITGSYTQNINLTPVESENYPLVTALEFNVESIDSSATLSKITVRVSATEGARISKAYLYQGDSVPLASAVVSKGVATFTVPPGTNGASFGSDIPAKFTVKVDVTDVDFSKTTGNYLTRNTSYTETKLAPFTVTSTIKPTDVQVVDLQGQIFKNISGSASGDVDVSGYTCEGRGCA